VDTIYRKYFKGIISYEGVLRITDYPVPIPALREAIFNAIVHRDYTTGIPIQIKVFPDCVTVYNDGRLPENWTVDNLLKKHRSHPYNPKIAYTFYRAGFIETWGRGIERITSTCRDAGRREPRFEASSSEVSVTFFTDIADTVKDTVRNTVKDTVTATQNQILKLLTSNPRMTAKVISAELGINERNVKKNIRVLKEAGYIERVGSDKSGHWIINRLDDSHKDL
jgi:ATP-dependent DNA helicase RecG